MSLDFSIRPVGTPTATFVVQAPSPAVSNAVATVLPTSRSVTVAEPATPVRNDVQTISDEAVSHQAFYDRAAASLVFQVVDAKNDQVVDQYPDEAVLRRRAYFHALDLSKNTLPRALPTDRSA
jgi:hypothetical protein